MKYILTILLFFGTLSKIYAQTTEDIGKIAFAVVVPDAIAGLNTTQLAQLESKISKIVTTAGIAASGYNSNFVIYPKIDITNEEVIEGGMLNIYMVNADLSLFIKKLDNNVLYSSYTITIKGTGSTKASALANAISKIQTNSTEYTTFINNSKTKIIKYYETKCPDIINAAKLEANLQNYELAISNLMAVPQDISSCYNLAQLEVINIYKEYQNKVCSEMIIKAQATLASNNYKETLNIIGNIDPSSKCYQDALTIINKVENKINAEEKKAWDFKQQQYNDAVSLEKQRVSAIKEIAVAYYKRAPQRINYNIIIR